MLSYGVVLLDTIVDSLHMCSVRGYALFFFFFFKQKTAYEMRISDWSSDVCSSDLELFKSQETIEKHRASRQGYKHSEETKRKISESQIEIGRASCRERVCQYV